MKDPNDKEKWLIDEPAAEVVRKIYALCLAGRDPSQIAKQFEEENILVPSAYYESIGRTHAQKVPSDYCKWDQKTVVGILENRQYTGCAVNSRVPLSVTRCIKKSIMPRKITKSYRICRSL